MKLYALQTPRGRIVWNTIADTKRGCWGNSFNYVASILGQEWESKYWKRWDASRMSAIRDGFSIIEVEIVPASTRSKT